MHAENSRFETSVYAVDAVSRETWCCEWFDKHTERVSYWYTNSRDEAEAEARRSEPTSPYWIEVPSW